MATVEEFVFTRLSALTATRVYRVKMPDNPQFPAITYATQYGETEESFDGFSKLRTPVVSIDCWAKTAKEAQTLAESARAMLQGYKGQYENLVIQNVLSWSHHDLYDTDTEVFHVACSCRVHYYAL